MRDIEAMWTVRFNAREGGEHFNLGGGIAVIETGRLYGGDSGYAYLGTIEVVAGKVSGTLRIIRHDPDITSIFGDRNEFTIAFQGTRVSEDRIVGELGMPGAPPADFVMERLVDLP